MFMQILVLPSLRRVILSRNSGVACRSSPLTFQVFLHSNEFYCACRGRAIAVSALEDKIAIYPTSIAAGSNIVEKVCKKC